MQLNTETFGNVAVVHAPEELGADQAENFTEAALRQTQVRMVLDLDPVESLDSAGLNALLDVQDALRGQGGDLKISTANACNRKILELTRLDRSLDVFDNVLDAVKSYR